MARQPSDAQNSVFVKQYGKESLSDDLPLPKPPTIDTAADLDGEVIVTSAERINGDYLDALAFGEEKVEVLMNPGREEWAPLFEVFGVNGQFKAVQVNVVTRIERKFVEGMARSMPMRIATRSGEDPSDALTFNKTDRSISAGFSFAVVKDDNPKGVAWLQSLRSDTYARQRG